MNSSFILTIPSNIPINWDLPFNKMQKAHSKVRRRGNSDPNAEPISPTTSIVLDDTFTRQPIGGYPHPLSQVTASSITKPRLYFLRKKWYLIICFCITVPF